MNDIYDTGGIKIEAMELSENQLASLDAGSTITVRYHTPKMQQGMLGDRNGTYTLTKGEQIVVDEPKRLREHAVLLLELKNIREADVSRTLPTRL